MDVIPKWRASNSAKQINFQSFILLSESKPPCDFSYEEMLLEINKTAGFSNPTSFLPINIYIYMKEKYDI